MGFAQTVADKLVVEFFTRNECPQRICTDQEREFQSDLFKILCLKFGIRQTRNDSVFKKLGKAAKRQKSGYD